MGGVAQPVGTVTLLFTDIEGSTRLLEELGTDAYREALAEHRRIVREACARQDGYEVDYEGDAFFYAFATAQAAVNAVTEAMTGLDGGPIRIRVGIHTGEPALDPPKYVGIDVHRAARIMATAHGGQVVLSPTTVALLEPGSIELKELGQHRLKDLTAPIPLHQLRLDGLPDQFPPLKTLYRSNLPVPATRFLGRHEELHAVVERLTHPDTRLLTLTGPGGTGKTRLALQAAAEAADHYPDGITWIPLAPLRDPSRALAQLAEAVGARTEPGLTLAETLALGFAGRRPLFVLDNAEHLLPELAATLAELRSAVPTATMLVTSRERLQLDGEQVYAVPSLGEDEAAGLFLERARALGVDLDDTPAVRELCARLDQLPLALELAAARATLFGPGQLLDRLDERLDLFTGGRDADPRQQTLRAMIAWSHDLLDEREQRLFRRIAVFVGGCTYAAAEQIAQADPDTLQSLLDRSLLRRTDSDLGPRYWMLETIREYALERLEQKGELEALEQRHLEFYARLADDSDAALKGPDQHRWLATLDEEAANWRAGLRRELHLGDTDRAAAMAVGLELYWWYRGLAEEGLPVFTALMEKEVADPWTRGRLLQSAGDLAYYLDDRELERRYLVEAAELFERLADTDAMARAYASLVWTATSSGDPGSAERYAKRALEALGDTDEPWLRSYVLVAASLAAAERGDLDEATRIADRALHVARDGGNPRSLWLALGTLGWFEFIRANYEAARKLATEAIDVADPRDREMVAINEGNLGFSDLMLGRAASAANHFAASLSSAPPGNRRIPAEIMLGVAALVAAAHPDAAVRLWAASLELHESCGAPLGPALGRVESERLGPLRSELEIGEFDLLWEDGRRLTTPAAIDLALAEAKWVAAFQTTGSPVLAQDEGPTVARG